MSSQSELELPFAAGRNQTEPAAITIYWRINPALDNPMAGFRHVKVDGQPLNLLLSKYLDSFVKKMISLIGSSSSFERLAQEKHHYVIKGVRAFRTSTSLDFSDHFLCAALQLICNYILTLDSLFNGVMDASEPNAKPIVFELCRELSGLIETPETAGVFGVETNETYYNPKRYLAASAVSLPEVANIFRSKTATLTTFAAKAQDRLRHILVKNGMRDTDIGLVY